MTWKMDGRRVKEEVGACLRSSRQMIVFQAKGMIAEMGEE